MSPRQEKERGLVSSQAPSFAELGEVAELARSYATEAKAENTRRAYRSDWAAFTSWCDIYGAVSLPCLPEVLALYITEMADRGRKVATIERALVAISQAHKTAGHQSPRGDARVQAVRQGIRRKLGIAQNKKAPLLPVDLRTIVEHLPAGLRGLRDRALLLLGEAGGFRRSELVAFDVGDVSFVAEGAVVSLKRSKTDQEGAGRKVGIPFGHSEVTCPIRALRSWLDTTHLKEGPLFRSVNRWGGIGGRLDGNDVGRILKRAAQAVGLDPARLGAHSLRAGFVTAAFKAGKSERAIMAQTGHKSERVMRGYYRDEDLFSDNAAKGIGL